MENAIAISELHYEYGQKVALKGVSLTIPSGTVTALVGPNGAGKSTLLRCIAALQFPFSGRVEIFGQSTDQDPRRCHRLVGYLSDFFGLYEELTVEQSLLHVGALHGFRGAALKSQVEKTISNLGLSQYRSNTVDSLSRGWRQRVGIAQASIHDPKILILDEPAAGLDPEARVGLSRLICDLRDTGTTLIVSSHILAELEEYCSAMLTIKDGAIAGHVTLESVSAATTTFALGCQVEVGRAQEALQKVEIVKEIRIVDGKLHLVLPSDAAQQAAVLKEIVSLELGVYSFAPFKENFQDLYLTHVRKEEK